MSRARNAVIVGSLALCSVGCEREADVLTDLLNGNGDDDSDLQPEDPPDATPIRTDGGIFAPTEGPPDAAPIRTDGSVRGPILDGGAWYGDAGSTKTREAAVPDVPVRNCEEAWNGVNGQAATVPLFCARVPVSPECKVDMAFTRLNNEGQLYLSKSGALYGYVDGTCGDPLPVADAIDSCAEIPNLLPSGVPEGYPCRGSFACNSSGLDLGGDQSSGYEGERIVYWCDSGVMLTTELPPD